MHVKTTCLDVLANGSCSVQLLILHGLMGINSRAVPSRLGPEHLSPLIEPLCIQRVVSSEKLCPCPVLAQSIIIIP